MANPIYKESYENDKIDSIKKQIKYINSYIKEIYSKKLSDEITDKEIEIIDKLKKLYKDIGDISELEFQQIENEINSLENHISILSDKQHKKEFIAMFAAIKPINRHSIKSETNKQNNRPKVKTTDPIIKNQDKNNIEIKIKKNQNFEVKESIKFVIKLITSIRQQIKNVISSSSDMQSIKNNTKQQDSLNIPSSRYKKEQNVDKKHDLGNLVRNNQDNEPKSKINNNENKYVNSVNAVNVRNIQFSESKTMVDKIFNRSINEDVLKPCENCR